MNLIEQRNIIQDAIDGMAIQMKKVTDPDSEWHDADPRIFSFGIFNYRRKPVPRDLWLYETVPGLWQQKWNGIGVHFREVL